MTSNPRNISELLVQIQAAFLDAPALRLTVQEAERRFGLSRSTCEAIFQTLVDAHVLTRTTDGHYRRFFPELAHAA